MKYFFFLIPAILCTSFSACTSLKKDNKTQQPTEIKAEIKDQLNLYRALIEAQLDDHGLVVMGDSIGDSALFSCLARTAGAANFDPAILFKNGKPLRHPDIDPSISKTPMSKDMMNGILWCLYSLHLNGDDIHAIELTEALIDFGKANKITIGVDFGWKLCSNEDKIFYNISEEDWAGRCLASPGVVKDVYRLAKLLGIPCDEDCTYFMTVGPNIPADKKGFERHLAVLSTLRNGLIEGAINDNSLGKVLETAHEAELRNALYQAAFHTFTDGNQTDAYAILNDQNLFPKDKLPTKENFCTPYIFQRDRTIPDVSLNPDWLPCPNEEEAERGRGIDFAFAAALALGEIK